MRARLALHPVNTWYNQILILAMLIIICQHLIVVLISISLMVNNIEHLFLCLSYTPESMLGALLKQWWDFGQLDSTFICNVLHLVESHSYNR